jgi:hypothetical protein
MHQTIRGADAIIALRCAEVSGQWEAICTDRATRQGPPDQPVNEDDLHPYKTDAHPRRAPSPAAVIGR